LARAVLSHTLTCNAVEHLQEEASARAWPLVT
jgi:hypothetical protein